MTRGMSILSISVGLVVPRNIPFGMKVITDYQEPS